MEEDKLPKFVPSGSAAEVSARWKSWLRAFQYYAEGKGITGSSRLKSLLLHHAGMLVQEMFEDMVDPDAASPPPSDNVYKEALRKLNHHFLREANPVFERHVFRQMSFQPSESFDEFVARLRKQARLCEFGGVQEEQIRDQLVACVKQDELRKKLLSIAKLTLDGALTECRLWEQSSSQSSAMSSTDTVPTHAVGQRSSKPNHSDCRCYRCNQTGHFARSSTCPARSQKCKKCGIFGHFEVCCKSKSTHTHAVVESVSCVGSGNTLPSDLGSADASGESEPCFGLHQVEGGSAKPYMVTVLIDSVPLTMELDTGAARSLLPENLYLSKFSQFPLKPSSVVLSSYSGDPVPVVGEIMVPVSYGSASECLQLLVVQSNKTALFGRDWLQRIKLNWQEIFSVEPPAENPKQFSSIDELLEEYADLFDGSKDGMIGQTANLHLKGEQNPVFQKARRVPYSLQEAVEEELDRLVASGILEPVESSDWASPTVNVPKTRGEKLTVRICGDYKKLNACLEDDNYPLPTIQDLFAKLAHKGKNPNVFCSLDLSGAFNQLHLDDSSIPLLTLNTHKGLYRIKRLSYGVKTAPSIFQATMDKILSGIGNTADFIDDLLVFGDSNGTCLQTLAKVFARLRAFHVRLNKAKCRFMQKSVEYLGHVVSQEGIKPMMNKIQAIRDAKTPTNVTELKSFLGLANYYGKFVPDLSSMLHPLYARLHKATPWSWDEECAEAFTEVKTQLSSECVLVHYDASKPIVLSTDASPYGVGAVLSHRMEDGSERPIAYASRTLSSAEQNYSQIEKEALGIVFGLKKFHLYLFGRRFVIATDHQPLTKIFGPREGIPVMAAARMQRWALLLAGYDYEICYRSSAANANADALSRLPANPADVSDEVYDVSVHAIALASLPLSSASVAAATKKDPALSRVVDFTLYGWPDVLKHDVLYPYFCRRTEISVEDGCLLWGHRVIIPPVMHSELLAELHSLHPGVCRMKQLARSHVWWPGLDAAIEDLVLHCQLCQMSAKMPPKAPFVPWQWPAKPWARIHVDFAMYESKNYLIVVDSHSKWLEVLPMTVITSTATITVLRNLFAAYGLPMELVSDNGPQFVSEEFEVFLRSNGVKHSRSPPYHPATNGQAERYVQIFKKMMAKNDASLPLSHQIANLLFTYRNTPHSITGKTPAELFLNRAPRTKLSLLKPHLGEKVEKRVTLDPDCSARQFSVSEPVLVRDVRHGQWMPAVVSKVNGPRSYCVTTDGDQFRYVHVDHMRPRPVAPPQPQPVSVPVTPVPAPSAPAPVVSSPEPLTTPESSMPEPQPDVVVRRSSRPPKPIVPYDV